MAEKIVDELSQMMAQNAKDILSGDDSTITRSRMEGFSLAISLVFGLSREDELYKLAQERSRELSGYCFV